MNQNYEYLIKKLLLHKSTPLFTAVYYPSISKHFLEHDKSSYK